MILHLVYSLRLRYPLLAIAAVLLTLTVIACQRSGAETAPDPGRSSRISVITSIHPMEYFAKRIGGDVVDVTNLLPAGVEAHDFDPSTGDLQRLARADLVIINGLELEPWMERAIRSLGGNASFIVVEAAEGASGRLLPAEGPGHDEEAEGDEEHGEYDPHVWLDPLLAASQAERIRDALIQMAPDHADLFTANAQALAQDLQALHERFETTLAACRYDQFVTTHAAYAYLAARYGLVQIAISGLTPEAEPSAQRLAQIVDQVRSLGLRYILVEPILGTRLADTVRRETGVDLIPIHQIESVTQTELAEHGDYMGLMENNLRSLSMALECSS